MNYNYKIEHRALPLSEHRVFGARDEAADFAFEVAESHGITLDTVSWSKAGGKWAVAQGREIVLPADNFGRGIVTILHELAHVAAPDGVGHTTEWAQWFLYLLREEVGVMAESALRWEMSK